MVMKPRYVQRHHTKGNVKMQLSVPVIRLLLYRWIQKARCKAKVHKKVKGIPA